MSDPIRTFRHFRDVPDTLWRWPNFSPAEIACRGTGQIKLHPAALDKLQALRDKVTQLNSELDRVKDAQEGTWDRVKVEFKKSHEDLKESAEQARKWLSEKIAP